MWINQADYKRIGALLTELRSEAGLTQAQLAVLLKKPQSFVSSYEGGQRRVDLLEFLAITAKLEVDPHAAFKRVIAGFLPKRKVVLKIPKPGPK